MKTQYPMIPFPLIVKATDGDTEAINQVLRGRMETRLITKILSFEIK